MDGACGTWRGTSGTVTVAGSGMGGTTVAGEKGEEDDVVTWRVGGLGRALVMFVRSLREKASMLMGMSVTDAFGSERGTS